MTQFTGQIVHADGTVIVRHVEGSYSVGNGTGHGRMSLSDEYTGDGMIHAFLKLDSGLSAEVLVTKSRLPLTRFVEFQFAKGIPK